VLTERALCEARWNGAPTRCARNRGPHAGPIGGRRSVEDRPALLWQHVRPTMVQVTSRYSAVRGFLITGVSTGAGRCSGPTGRSADGDAASEHRDRPAQPCSQPQTLPIAASSSSKRLPLPQFPPSSPSMPKCSRIRVDERRPHFIPRKHQNKSVAFVPGFSEHNLSECSDLIANSLPTRLI
jgi:hypothetical protein